MVTRMENEIADKLAAIPGVSGVGFASAVPMEGIEPNWDQIDRRGQELRPGESTPAALQLHFAGIFQTWAALVAGRDFNWDDMYGCGPW